MSWQGILGHDQVRDRFLRSLSQRRLATTFLFVGPEGVGKRTFALKLAQAMLCEQTPEAELDPCGQCPACRQTQSDSHPDLFLVRKPDDRAFIPVETFVGDRDHRMRTGLCHFMSLTPSGGKRRIAVIDDADWLNQEGANSLLKTLEEPTPGALIVLIGTSEQKQLPTIRSRSQVIRFQRLSDDDLAQCLLNQGLAETPAAAAAMASRAEGSLARAVALADEATLEFRRRLWEGLAGSRLDRAELARTVTEYMDAAGKETPAKRAQLRRAITSAMEFYAAVGRRLNSADASPDRDLAASVEAACGASLHDPALSASLVERCVDALRQVNSNVNLSMLIDAWLCDLAVATRSGQPLLNEAF